MFVIDIERTYKWMNEWMKQTKIKLNGDTHGKTVFYNIGCWMEKKVDGKKSNRRRRRRGKNHIYNKPLLPPPPPPSPNTHQPFIQWWWFLFLLLLLRFIFNSIHSFIWFFLFFWVSSHTGYKGTIGCVFVCVWLVVWLLFFVVCSYTHIIEHRCVCVMATRYTVWLASWLLGFISLLHNIE